MSRQSGSATDKSKVSTVFNNIILAMVRPTQQGGPEGPHSHQRSENTDACFNKAVRWDTAWRGGTTGKEASVLEEESCVPVQAERKNPVREVKDLREVKASGARGSRTLWMATVEHPAKADSEPHGRMVGTRGSQTRIGFSVICRLRISNCWRNGKLAENSDSRTGCGL